MSETLWWVIWLPVAYLLGSVPTGIVMAWLFRRVDIRSYGSGSSGATNVTRTLGPAAGAAVLMMDLAKGLIATFVPWQFADSSALTATAGLLAVAGHVFPVFARFHGGKGVATGLGAVYVFAPWAGVLATLGVLVAAATRYVSLGSMVGTLFGMGVLIALIVLDRLDPVYLVFGVGALLIIELRHAGNLVRIIRGEENRFSFAPRPKRARTRVHHP
jgi:glycerol-3-phosphate acyltransferase PlsY